MFIYLLFYIEYLIQDLELCQYMQLFQGYEQEKRHQCDGGIQDRDIVETYLV